MKHIYHRKSGGRFRKDNKCQSNSSSQITTRGRHFKHKFHHKNTLYNHNNRSTTHLFTSRSSEIKGTRTIAHRNPILLHHTTTTNMGTCMSTRGRRGGYGYGDRPTTIVHHHRGRGRVGGGYSRKCGPKMGGYGGGGRGGYGGGVCRRRC